MLNAIFNSGLVCLQKFYFYFLLLWQWLIDVKFILADLLPCLRLACRMQQHKFLNCMHLNKQEQMCSSLQDKSVKESRFVPIFTPSGSVCSWLFVYQLVPQPSVTFVREGYQSKPLSLRTVVLHCFLLLSDSKYFTWFTFKTPTVSTDSRMNLYSQIMKV